MAEIITHRDGSIATIVISNPAKRNAMSPEMWTAFGAALDSVDADPAIRAIVITGHGDQAFVSGADISRLDPQASVNGAPAESAMPYMAPLRCTKPVIAKIRGYCFGGGLGLAAACDLRFCSENAEFRMPAARLGLGYSYVGVRRFVTLLGEANTLDLFMSARRFDAAEALRMGFVARIVPSAELDAAVADYCTMLAENAPLTLQAAKRTVREILKDPGERDTAAAQALIDRALGSADVKEGRQAFLEKRRPVFRGK